MRSNQKGVAVVLEVLIVAAVLGALGFVGYRVWQSRDKTTSSQGTAATPAAKQEKKAKWQSGGFAVQGSYADASVVEYETGKWRMYYGIQPEVQGNKFEVYSATSTDGKTWAQESGTRKTFATFPEVIKLPDGRYRMYFQQAGEIKSAISSDGLSFSDESGTRIDKANPDNLNFDNVAAPAVVKRDDGSYLMVYRGTINQKYGSEPTPNQNTQLLLWATSTDGLAFTKKGVAVDSRNSTFDGLLDGPELTDWDGTLRLTAWSYTGVYSFPVSGDTFGKETFEYQNEKKGSMDAQPPGDPTFAKINDTWYMYYGQTGAESGIHYATLEK